MQVQIQCIHFDADADLIKETTEKLSKLDKLYDRIEKCSVMLKKENSTDRKNFFAEVRMAVPKDDLFASSKEESFASALDNVIDDLKKQLVKRKEKLKKFDRAETDELI